MLQRPWQNTQQRQPHRWHLKTLLCHRRPWQLQHPKALRRQRQQWHLEHPGTPATAAVFRLLHAGGSSTPNSTIPTVCSDCTWQFEGGVAIDSHARINKYVNCNGIYVASDSSINVNLRDVRRRSRWQLVPNASHSEWHVEQQYPTSNSETHSDLIDCRVINGNGRDIWCCTRSRQLHDKNQHSSILMGLQRRQTTTMRSIVIGTTAVTRIITRCTRTTKAAKVIHEGRKGISLWQPSFRLRCHKRQTRTAAHVWVDTGDMGQAHALSTWCCWCSCASATTPTSLLPWAHGEYCILCVNDDDYVTLALTYHWAEHSWRSIL